MQYSFNLNLLFAILFYPVSNLTSDAKKDSIEIDQTLDCDYSREYLVNEQGIYGHTTIYRQRSKSSNRYHIKGSFKGPDSSQDWSFIDWVELADCWGDGQPRLADYTVSDEDNNGIREFYITYVLFPDVTDCCYPAPIKTLVYENGVKYAIRGNTRLSDGIWLSVKSYPGADRGGQMSIDGKNSLLEAKKPIQQKAISIFKRFQIK